MFCKIKWVRVFNIRIGRKGEAHNVVNFVNVLFNTAMCYCLSTLCVSASSQLPHSILSLCGDHDSFRIKPQFVLSCLVRCNTISLLNVIALQCCLRPR